MCSQPNRSVVARLEDLVAGARVTGVVGEPVTVLHAQWHGPATVELTYKSASGQIGQRMLFRGDEPKLSAGDGGVRAFDALGDDFLFAADVQRVSRAGLSKSMLAVATSDVQPLPHQIRAVYEELLPRTPLRFLLADDPGAGKTIMAGLYIKELILRQDVQRCLVVAPGGLIDQWHDELLLKFGLRFDVLGRDLIDSHRGTNVFDSRPLLLARMDQLSRSPELVAQLEQSRWDLVVVDEAHRMGANHYGTEVRKTKRFELGEALGRVARHLLLMTATPHAGKHDDFQLFLSLLDPDRFHGRAPRRPDTTGVMRRMIKEDLLTFDGRRLFPERIAETVPYELSELEYALYEQVTDYVREGMNRAERVGGQRKNTVGFALTVLQRRLASSPAAIHQSLVRRLARLSDKRTDLLSSKGSWQLPPVDPDDWDNDVLPPETMELTEDELADGATAAQTVAELDAEIAEVRALTDAAAGVRAASTDRKWAELHTILRDRADVLGNHGEPRKIIVFTEHRDTLDYLASRIRSTMGDSSVVTIHGGLPRDARRRAVSNFSDRPSSRVLVATDAAGEGLNLQAAHLVVNYDLPWNPNRIEQRFGRVHRIGQTEVCRLWNLVATNTREGEVFSRLLEKIEEQREAYGGKVFDVLGKSFADTPLRDLLVEAIRYGEHPDTRARMRDVIDTSVSDGLAELLAERALVTEQLLGSDLVSIQSDMEEARARRVGWGDLERVWTTAFARIGGRVVRRERGRYEVLSIPPKVRGAASAPLPASYDRVVFDPDLVEVPGGEPAQLLGPGHPLLDAVIGQALDHAGGALRHGSVVRSAWVSEPTLVLGLEQTIVDGEDLVLDRHFGYFSIDAFGRSAPAGAHPFEGSTPVEPAIIARITADPWLQNAEASLITAVVTAGLSDYVETLAGRRRGDLERERTLVRDRLASEIEQYEQAARDSRRAQSGESPDGLLQKAADLTSRLEARMRRIDLQMQVSAQPPRVLSAAVVIPRI
ncbi:DEAD/DEAH box helicase [Geodermatophilaceae bacterium NBWT11]|nr:DEAD/DEAH box helicase [Geodermatophilaceae bacterium NBWT11]